MAQTRFKIAETGDRVIAGIIDFIVAQLLAYTVGSLFCCPTCGLSYLIGNIYLLVRDYQGKSIGKRLMKLKVVNYETGQDITFSENFLRNITSCICCLEWLTVFFNDEGRRVGDSIGKTIVISEK
jgi:uncharacterized RDD family membrane protein YckC